MKKNVFNKLALLCFSVLITITFISCNNKDKQTIISSNIIKDINEGENQIKKNIELGNKFLEEGKYDDAKKSYEKSISMNIHNKQTYLEIKDKYLEKGRLDDGFYIIKLAVQNNADYSNMKALLEDIKQKFEVTNIEKSVYQNDVYTLPKNITLKVNNEVIQATIKWSNSTIDTSKVGTFSYAGIAEQYERTVKLTLKVEQYMEPFYGNWVIKKVVGNAPVGTFGDVDIKNILGRKLSFSTEKASCFGDQIEALSNIAINPVYKKTVVSKIDFAAGYRNRLTFDNLGIKSDSITQISVVDSNNNRCIFYIKDNNTLILYGGGVYFELDRENNN